MEGSEPFFSRMSNLTILKHFPRTMAAEHEVLFRMQAAAEEAGMKVEVLEVEGTLKQSEIDRIDAKTDIVLDLHFQYPKFLKANSVGVLWTPATFMTDWGLANVWANQISHDVICITGKTAFSKVLEEYRNYDSVFPTLNHGLPGSWLLPSAKGKQRNKLRAFYAGIGWDKFNNRPGRHQEIFKELDSLDVLDIYGPDKIQGLKPWKGFKSYRGSIPFDGRSILNVANNSGAMLVLSSQPHNEANIMSSRFFEALASRCVVIGDNHPFIREVLGDYAFYLDLSKNEKQIAEQLLEILTYLDSNPGVVETYTDKGAEIFLRDFDLTSQLAKALKFNRPSIPVIDVACIIFGEHENPELTKSLLKFGISEVHRLPKAPQLVEALIKSVASLTEKDTIILLNDSEVMDNLSDRIRILGQMMDDQKSNIGALSSTVLFNSGHFEPAIVGKSSHDSFALQGLLIRKDAKAEEILVAPIDPVISVRLLDWSNFKWLRHTRDPLVTLRDALNPAAPLRKHLFSAKLQLETQISKDGQFASESILETLVSSGRTTRRRILFSLLATIPGAKYFKKVLRPVADYLIRHAE